jgi:HAE1 family hydrophobic/amphiphilic exporter-1
VNLSRWSLRSPVTSSMVLVCVVVLGALAAPKLPLAFLPDVDFPGLEISIPYPNSLPAQVEEEITRPAEEALATMSRVRRITSQSSATGATINVQFAWGEDLGPLRVEAREKLDRIRDQLPRDVDLILVNGFRSSDIPVIECRVSADRDLSRAYALLNRHVADPLRRVPGVAKVELYGVEPPQVQVDFSLDALQRHGLDGGAVVQRLEASNRSIAAGQLKRGDESWPLRVVNQFASLDDIGSLPIDDKGLKLRDVAAISYREPDLDYGRHLDKTRAIGLNVIKESGSNTVDVARRSREALAEIARDPELTGVRVLTFTDQGEEITNSIRGLLESGLIGGFLAVLVLLFFLRNLITTLVVSTAIPFSLLAAAALMYFTGRTLNILSMMGLMLAVGMLVDNAVVVLESIYRHRQSGKSPLHAALAGAKEVQAAVVCATMTSIIVFLPLVLGGKTEITTWLAEVGRTIIFTLVCSLYLSLTAIPLAMGRFLPLVSPKAKTPGIGWISERYAEILAWTLKHRVAAATFAVVLFASSIAAFIPVNKSAFTGSKVEAVRLEYEFADNLNQHEVERYVTKVESWIQARKTGLHVKSTYSYFTHNYAFTRAYLASGFADDHGAEIVRKLLRKGLPELPGAKLKIAGADDDSDASRLSVNVFGDPGPRLTELAEEVRRRVALLPGVDGVERASDRGSKEIEVFVQRDRAARYGLSAEAVASSVALFFRGRPLSRFRGPDGEVQMLARLSEADRQSLGRLRSMPIAVPALAVGEAETSVPLGSVADFRTVDTPASIERQQRRSVASMTADVDSKKSAEIRKSVRRELDGMNFPPGYTWSFGSGFEEEDATQKEMLMNLVLALALVYVVMAALFESFLHPFAIMLALPFAFAGVAWMCLLTGTPFNLMAQIGILILVGIVVNNGIVLIHHVHQLRERDMPRTDALLKAGRDRLRPILMTTATTVLGLLPLAFGRTHVGDVLYFPLARTVIGGLLTSTLLTLLLVPCLYTLLEDSARVVSRAWAKQAAPALARAGVTALLVLALLVPAKADARGSHGSHEVVLNTVSGAWPAGKAKSVAIRFPVGELEVVAVDRPSLEAQLDVRGDDDSGNLALDRARKVRLVAKQVGDELRLSVEGWGWHIGGNSVLEGRIEVPRALALKVNMDVGELAVSGFTQATLISLDVGEATIACDPARIASIDVDLGIGEGTLVENGRSREWAGVFGGGFRWDGVKGGAPVRLRVGVGEATIHLDGADTADAAATPILKP